MPSVPAPTEPDEARFQTAEDLDRLPEDARMEIIGGELVPRAAPSFEHGHTQYMLSGTLFTGFQGKSVGDPPGGWWFGTEVELELERHEVYIPDLVGWRRDRVPERPRGRPVRIRPDWVCEILSPSNTLNDLVKKHSVYHRAGIPHYWVINPEEGGLIVYRWQEGGYFAALVASGEDKVRAEPFEAIEIALGVVFSG